MSFLTDEQKDLANEIAALLTERGETVCVAESTTGGLVSAALLWVAGPPKDTAGGGRALPLEASCPRHSCGWPARPSTTPVAACSTRLARARRWRVCRHRCLRTT